MPLLIALLLYSALIRDRALISAMEYVGLFPSLFVTILRVLFMEAICCTYSLWVQCEQREEMY